MEQLRKCCGVEPILVIENIGDTKLKTRQIKCQKCFRKTGKKRFLADAIREWNNPERVHVN